MKTIRILKRISKLILKLFSPIKTFYHNILTSKLFRIVIFFLKFNLISIGVLVIGYIFMSAFGFTSYADYLYALMLNAGHRLTNIISIVAAYFAGILLNIVTKTKSEEINQSPQAEPEQVESKSEDLSQEKFNLDKIMEILRNLPEEREQEENESKQSLRDGFKNTPTPDSSSIYNFFKNPYVIGTATAISMALIFYYKGEDIKIFIHDGGLGKIISLVMGALFGRDENPGPAPEGGNNENSEINLNDERNKDGDKTPVPSSSKSKRYNEYLAVSRSQANIIIQRLKEKGINPESPEAKEFIESQLKDPALQGIKALALEMVAATPTDVFDNLPNPKSPPLNAEQVAEISAEKSEWQGENVTQVTTQIPRNGAVSPLDLSGQTTENKNGINFKSNNSTPGYESEDSDNETIKPDSDSDSDDESEQHIESLISSFQRLENARKRFHDEYT